VGERGVREECRMLGREKCEGEERDVDGNERRDWRRTCANRRQTSKAPAGCSLSHPSPSPPAMAIAPANAALYAAKGPWAESSQAGTMPKRSGYCCWCIACSCRSKAAPS